MLKKLFGLDKKKAAAEPRMPEVDEPPGGEDLFAQARQAAAAGPPGRDGRHVVIVTPGRMLMFQPCPPPGSMPAAQVASIERLLPSGVQRNIAVIAYTELSALRADIGQAVPFFGLLLGLAYVGHAVWVFEGHASALAAGCKEADALIVDSGMLPHLHADWMKIAAAAMRNPAIYVHDRARYTLRKAL